ncbi:MAG TPA: glycoside hydrolase family 130 protein [Anaerolineales bacterium]|nr:glycoside hydrolase family 130 protein [Anaerolineales bacterium]
MEKIKQVKPEDLVGPLRTSPIIKRHPKNPIFTSEDVPYPSVIAYNAGVVKYQGQYVMVFRNDYNWIEEEQKAMGFQIGVAYSDDGISNWRVHPKPILEFEGGAGDVVLGSLDPRVTVLDGRIYITYTMFTKHGYRGTIAVTDDFENIEIVSSVVPDNRNIVLFPERINDRYIRLERPFTIDSRSQRLYDIWISESPDLVYWGKSQVLLCVEDIPYANERLGAGTPPVWTEHGWLSIFHAVDIDPSRGKNGWEDRWPKRYTAGVMLQDLDDPRKLIAYSKEPLIAPEPEFPYETEEGFRTNVIFPGGLVIEETGEVKIYYGAADTVECLATTTLDELIDFCLSFQ